MAKSLGSVDLLGLDQFGVNPGLNPIFGALIGGGIAGVTSVALRHTTTGAPQKWADLFGLGAGAAAAGVLYAMPGTRHAAFGALAGAFLAAGIGFLERVLLSPPAGVAGVGYPMIQQLGVPQIHALNGPQISEIPRAYGTIPGVAGAQLSDNSGPPISLMGDQSQAQQQATLMSGVQTSSLANQYGANLFGGRS